jgi:uncharacterized protein (DUF2267 family)
MAEPSVRALRNAVDRANVWVRDVSRELESGDIEEAYAVLAAVLHTLRDHLSMEEAAQLGAQLPVLIRGVYYQNWTAGPRWTSERKREQFFQRVADSLGNRAWGVSVEEGVRAVFRVLARRVSDGEIKDVVHMLPHELRELWPLDHAA